MSDHPEYNPDFDRSIVYTPDQSPSAHHEKLSEILEGEHEKAKLRIAAHQQELNLAVAVREATGAALDTLRSHLSQPAPSDKLGDPLPSFQQGMRFSG